MANNLSLKLIIDGTATGALKALGQVQSGATGVESQLKRLQDAGRNALQFAGVGFGISELIKLADTYTQMTSRLKLVTQYTGDFDAVFAGLSETDDPDIRAALARAPGPALARPRPDRRGGRVEGCVHCNRSGRNEGHRAPGRAAIG